MDVSGYDYQTCRRESSLMSLYATHDRSYQHILFMASSSCHVHLDYLYSTCEITCSSQSVNHIPRFVMKVLIVLCAVVAAAFAADDATSDAVAKFKATVKAQVGALFLTADTNKDGQFDKADMLSIFTDYDADGDKKVSQKEFVSKFAGSQTSLAVIAKGLFLELDMDRNGEVTDSDLDLYFRKIDQNDDGKVEKDEFEKYFTELFTILYILEVRQQAATTAASG
ncbi:uncharacterized protein [Haliotis asinina]|uniref:uncharacterized protein isoform X1 n=2 Tax=Haliotis asinina TaxID=109174 RepID=UPI003531CAFA